MDATHESSAEHGTRSRYATGCRCGDCTTANREYGRKWQSKRTPTAKHGTRTNYKDGCRCDECKTTMLEYGRKWREARLIEALNSGQHGINAIYTYGCRCDECKTAHSEYDSKYHKANRKRIRERQRVYGEVNREKAIERRRQSREANPEKDRKYYEANRDVFRRNDAARRARKKGALVEHVSPQAVYERDRWTCHICGEAVDRELKHPDPLSASLDHIIPLAKGGEHSYANCGTTHLGCNKRKGAKVA